MRPASLDQTPERRWALRPGFPTRLSTNPDLGASRTALVLTALAVTLEICVTLAWQRGHIGATLGDTDDATRMVLVRGFLGGKGWFDQFLGRLQPPVGVYLHWSRLIDGGLTGLIWLAEKVTSPVKAELAVRFAWPLMWIFPAVLSGLAITQKLGERGAVLACAVLMLLTMRLYIQFVPGRVDHHNIQIVLILGAMAAGLRASRRPAWAAVSGAATGLGLAIGLESLIFHALVGASFALRLAKDRNEAKAVGAYGLALASTTALFFCIETPPWRWSLSFCDEIGLNLVVAAAAAGLGIALAAALSSRAGPWIRIALVGLAGAIAVALYLGLDPQCIHGPFVALDPRVRPFWFDRIQEIQSWRGTARTDRAGLTRQAVMAALGIAGAGVLWSRPGRRTDPGVIFVALCVIAATLTTISARRMEAYLFWFSIPVLAAALSVAATRWFRDRLLPTVLATALLLPSVLAGAAIWGENRVLGRPPPVPRSATGKCFATRSYIHLAALLPGLVISETDLGPFILAWTRDRALAAPYHRMSIGILAAHDVLAATPGGAEALARAWRATYIVDCPPYPMNVGQGSFGAALRRGDTPPWLERLTKTGEVLQIYRLTPLERIPSVGSADQSATCKMGCRKR